MKKNLLFLLFFSCLLMSKIHAQNFCGQKLNEAEDKFEQGRFYEIPDILSLCLNNGFTKEEKIRAYRLLTITYLYLNNRAKADENYLALLELSPEFKINEETDPRELINHHKKFTTSPFVYLSIKAGGNISDYFIMNDYSLTSGNNGFEKIMRSVGYSFNIGAELTLSEYLNFGVEGSFTTKSFEYSNFQLFEINQEKGLQTSLKQVYSAIELPLYVKYSFYQQNKLSPFLLGGVAPSYLIMANSVKQTARIVGEQISTDYPNYEIGNARRKFNYSLLAGAGVKYKVGINYLTLGVRYQMTMLNYVNRNERYDTSLGAGESYRFGLLYVDDDFKLNNLSVMFGFVYPIYKPRKIAD